MQQVLDPPRAFVVTAGPGGTHVDRETGKKPGTGVHAVGVLGMTLTVAPATVTIGGKTVQHADRGIVANIGAVDPLASAPVVDSTGHH